MYFEVTWVTIAAVPHTIVSMKMLIALALHCQEVLVLLIIKILILSMVRNHDLVLSAFYMKLHCYFESNNDTSRFDIKIVCSKMFGNNFEMVFQNGGCNYA